MWQARRKAIAKYVELRETNRGEADAFIAKIIKPKEQLTTLFHHQDTGEVMTLPETIATMQADMMQRAERAWARDPGHKDRTERQVSCIRASFATRDPSTGMRFTINEPLFTLQELEEVLRNTRKTGATLRGSNAALKSETLGGKLTTFALMNLSLLKWVSWPALGG